MSFQKEYKANSSLSVSFSIDKKIFYVKDRPFKIFKTNKYPSLAILDLKTNTRISGLFETDQNKYRGDVKIENSKKKMYFDITFIENNQLLLEGFLEVFDYLFNSKGVTTPNQPNNSNLGYLTASESIEGGLSI